MSQHSDIARLDVNFLGAQIVQYDGEKLWVPVDEDGIRFVPQARDPTIPLRVQ